MIHFLHTFHPDPILFSFGIVKIHWYGLFVVAGVISAIFITIKIASYYKIDKEKIIDLAFLLVIFGLIGARIYDSLLEFNYYKYHPLDVFKVWNGGLAIHGGIVAGILVLFYFSKKEKVNFWLLASVLTPGLALAQAIGRWGNYFNQEIFGKPTSLPWGIPIDIANRPLQYVSYNYFHPSFLYESIGNFLIFLVLIILHVRLIKKQKTADYDYVKIIATYAILYSLLRFVTEFIRIDFAPVIFGLRVPQDVSLLIIFISIILLIKFIPKQTAPSDCHPGAKR